MKKRRITHQNVKWKNRMKRPAVTVLAFMLSTSSFGTVTAYADEVETVSENGGGTGEGQSEGQNSQASTGDSQPEIQISQASIEDSQLEIQVSQVDDEASQSENQSTQAFSQGEDDQTQQNDSSPNTYDAIERPKQSDTVEIIPSQPSDTNENETGIAEEGTTDSSSAGTDAKTESTTDETENTGDAGNAAESTAEKNYEYFYDKETGKFNVTFNIKEDANGDQTVELSKVLEEIRAAGESEFDSYLKSEKGQKEYEAAVKWGDKSITHEFNGVEYVLNLSSGEVNLYTEPGCTTVFDVYITNGSNHTYVYKDQSFTVATPDVSNDDETGKIGFDGQEVPKEYSATQLSLGYNKDPDDENAMNHLVDEALKENPTIVHPYYYVNADGEMTTELTKQTFPTGTQLVKKGSYYYIEGKGCYYGKFSSSDVTKKTVDGTVIYELKKDKTNVTPYAYSESGVKKTYEKQLGRCDSQLMNSDVKSALSQYMQAHNYTYESYILEYYNNRDNTQYQSIKDLVLNNENALKELEYHTTDLKYSIDTVVPYKYNNFYQNILSFNVGDSDTMQKFLEEYKTNEKDGHDDGYWSYAGTDLTIGDYMADKLNKTDGAWEKANQYFNALMASGITKEKATWAAFTMATNIDGKIASNNYQDTAWSWYSSLVLKQQDGTLNLTKVDTEGNQLGDDEGEGQTSFYLWRVDKKTETAEDGSQKTTDVTKYCVYVDPVYETVKNDDGSESQKLVKDGYYGWVEYDPENKALNYTITTTNGTLNIDYALLEGMVYYLQEKAAPDGYDVDSKIYVICDESAYKQMTEEKGVISVVNPATGEESATVYLGAIKGGETLKVNFINGKTVVVPDPDPTPDPTPAPDNGGSRSDTKREESKTTEVKTGEVLGVSRDPEVQVETVSEITEESGMVLGAERLPKTGDTGADAPFVMFGFGLIAALYAWISRKHEDAEVK